MEVAVEVVVVVVEVVVVVVVVLVAVTIFSILISMGSSGVPAYEVLTPSVTSMKYCSSPSLTSYAEIVDL